MDDYSQKRAEPRKGRLLAKVGAFLVSNWYVWLLFLIDGITERDLAIAMALLLVCLVGWLLYRFVRWSKDRGIKWGEIGSTLFLLLFTYFIGLGMLGGDKAWHHLFALPVGFLFLWLTSRR